jgi:hypothetical protein
MTKSSSPRPALDADAILGVQKALNSALTAFREAGEQLDVEHEPVDLIAPQPFYRPKKASRQPPRQAD